jgi:hypothetical protein
MSELPPMPGSPPAVAVRRYDFPGRTFIWSHPSTIDDPDLALIGALRRVAPLVTATALRVGLRLDGAARETWTALRTPEAPPDVDLGGPTTVLPHLDAEAVASWIAGLPTGQEVASCEVVAGRYAVPLEDGARLAIAGDGAVTVRDGGIDPSVGLGASQPPMTLRYRDQGGGQLVVGVHWSAWYEADGVATPLLRRLLSELAADGWVLTDRPSDGPSAPHVGTHPGTPVHAADRSWCELPAMTVVLGLEVEARDRLATQLAAIDERDRDAEPALGFGGFDRAARVREIAAALEVSLGHVASEVAAGQIMRHPVTNGMWRAFMRATGAARPASWGSGEPDDQEFVSGVSWREADAFARHHGWSLPTEGEWVLAATGGSPRSFPWGDDFAPRGSALRRDGVPWPVGRAPELGSPLGVEDLLGAFCEYTRDPWRALPGAAPRPGVAGDQRVARGVAPRVPTCIAARRPIEAEHRFKLARFRCVRR